jgi:hypothetical protein
VSSNPDHATVSMTQQARKRLRSATLAASARLDRRVTMSAVLAAAIDLAERYPAEFDALLTEGAS